MFPAAQKTFKTKQKYSTNNNLGKRLHFFFDKNKTLSIIILASLVLCFLSFTFLYIRRVQPNSNIRSLASHNKAILENKNPNFNVFFGERNTPDKQWVRFEAKASSKNPFEESQKGFFGQILDTVRPKRVLGIEFSLEQAGIEKVKTSTEFIENVEPKEGDNPYTSSQKPHVLNTDVVDGIDIEYQILEGLGLKEDIIIKDLDLYTKECEDIANCDLAFNEFVFNLKLDDGLILKRAWYTYKGKNTETYYFTDERGNYIGHFLPSWAIDSNGVKTHHIDIKVEEEKGNLKVKVVIDNDWLFSEERIFPIRIDPTIVHDTEIDFGDGSFVNTEIRNGPELGLKEPIVKLIDANTAGYWTLDETGGSGAYLLDSSGNNNHGTPTGTTYTTGKIGGARSFNGSSDYITLGNPTELQITGNQTISMWLKPSNFSDRRNPYAKCFGGEGSIVQETNGTLTYYYGTAGSNASPYQELSSNQSLTLNQWNHIAIVRDFTDMKLYWYINGNLTNSATTTYGYAVSSTLPAYIASGHQNRYAGVIDDLRIDNVARTAEEIQRMYSEEVVVYKTSFTGGEYTSPNIDFESNATLESLSWTSEGVNTGDGEIPYNNNGLVAQWNFNNTSGTTLTNNAGSCGTSCNATLSNFSNTSGQDVAIGSGWTNIHRRWGNGALMFDGVDDYATLNSNSSLRPANNFSVEAWVKVSNNTDFNIIITHADNGGGDDGWTLRVADTGRAQFYATNLNGFSNQNIQSNTLIDLNEWYYLVGVYDNSVLKIYVNGILDNTKIAQGDVRYEVTDYVTIGRRGGTHLPNTQFFHGTIDVIRFSQRVLSPSEILSNYQAGNIEFQYRDSGNDEEWVGGSEEVIDNFENNNGWQTTDGNTLQKDSTEYSIEGSYALKLGSGNNIDANTAGYWTLDETAGSGAYLLDSSGNNNHGTPTGTTYTSGKIGGARGFNGSSDYITLGNPTELQITGNQTISMWLKPSNFSDRRNPYAKCFGGEGSIVQETNGTLTYYYGTAGSNASPYQELSSNQSLTLNQWNHIAIVRDFTNMKLYWYINGNLTNSATTTYTYAASSTLPAYIASGNRSRYAGVIDDVRIDNVARTAEEIASFYRYHRLGKDHYVNKTLSNSVDLTDSTMIPFWIASDRLGSNLEFTYGNSKYVNNQPDANTVGFWRLDEESGSGAYLLDSSGNNNHGTPSNTTFLKDGKIGGARSFNGSNSVITLGATGRPTNNFTVEAWFTTSVTHEIDTESTSGTGGTSGQKYLFYPNNESSNGGMGVSVGLNGISVYEHGTSYMPALAVYNGSVRVGWNHLAVTYINKTPSIYLNGQLVRIGQTSPRPTVYAPIYIGGSAYGYHSGYVDEVRISNIARTPEEIRQIYEMGRRTHPIVVTFNANLKSTNLITGINDLSFDITTDSIENIDKGEKIIIKENYNGTEYIAQGDIETINKSTGAITVSSWDSGSTSPHYGIHSIGFSTNATVFKWQKEYIDIRFPLPEDKDNISELTFRKTTKELATFWIDNMKKAKYLTDSSGSTFEEVKNIQEAQYKSIFTTWDKNVSSDFYLTSVTLDYNDNNPPTAPTNLLTQGQTNPIRISTPTPYFSAIFNDPDTGDTGTKYQIQVNNSSDFSGGLTWDSGINIMTATSVGARSPNLTYAGPTLPMDGTTYYWRIKFIDYGGLESPWSSTAQFTMNKSPTAPTNLLTQGQTNPIRISTSTPYFSAIFNDPDTGDTGVKYQIQVNNSSDFSGALIWDSGIKTMTATSVGARSPNLTYAGTALPMDGTTYYWRIKFIDYGGLESPWSSTAQFTMNRPPTAPTDLLTQGQTNPIRISTPTPYFSAIFNDLDTGDTGIKYQIQVNTTGNFSGALIWDSGIKTMTATSVGARSPNITYAGAALPMDGTIYYWRIKFIDYGGLESLWSSIAQFTMNNSPSVPTDLLTQGQTNPLKVTTPTPYFSAIFNDPDTGDTGIKYQIQVNVQDNFQPISMIWDSGIKTMTATSVGARSPNITYAGTTLPMDGTKYYWRIKFIDYAGLESPWSSTISTDYFILSGLPTATDLQTDGMTNPTSVLKPPSFSAIYNDPNNDNSSYYQIQVNTTSNFLGTTMWDSGKKVITLSPGTRSPWIPYAGTNLNYNGTKYYVRMKFWDSDDNESTWVTGNFTDNPGRFQLEGLKLESLKID